LEEEKGRTASGRLTTERSAQLSMGHFAPAAHPGF